jgi:CRP-like cAMP-binding protein
MKLPHVAMKQKGAEMHIDQADLFEGMDRSFIQEFMALTVKERYAKGDFIFHVGDKAEFYYTLVEGCVKISIGDDEIKVYTISNSGEAFGLSSILDRNYYFASASCLESTQILKIEENSLNQFLQDHPKSSSVFYKRIANRLAQRLVECYKII